MEYMPGTEPVDPNQQQFQMMLAEALRQQPQQQAQQQAGNRVVSAGAMGDGLTQGGIGAMGGALRGMGQNIGTAAQYGTNPFSQQTNMLAAQDAAFR